MRIRSALALLALAFAASAMACREEKAVEHAVEAVDRAGKEANARSPAIEPPKPGLEAVDHEARKAAEDLDEEARGLVGEEGESR